MFASKGASSTGHNVCGERYAVLHQNHIVKQLHLSINTNNRYKSWVLQHNIEKTMGPTNIVEASGPPLPASIRDWTYIPEAKIRCTWCWIEQVCRLHWEYLSRKVSLGSNLLVHLQRLYEPTRMSMAGTQLS